VEGAFFVTTHRLFLRPDANAPGTGPGASQAADRLMGNYAYNLTNGTLTLRPTWHATVKIPHPLTTVPTSPDEGLSVSNFSARLGDAMCGSLARCCYGDASLADKAPLGNGNVFHRAACAGTNHFGTSGLEGSSVGASLVGGGNVVLDKAKAQDCLAQVKALPCDTPAATFAAARAACFGALRGVLTAGACKGNIECAEGFFCKTPEGSASNDGVCTPLRSIDGACGDFGDHNYADAACSWRGGGNTKAFCALANFGGAKGVGILPPAQWKCEAGKPNGASCGNSTWCADGICDETTGVCSATSKLFAMQCSIYAYP
jgi:hypothetical protein